MNIATPWLLKPTSQAKQPNTTVHRFFQNHGQSLRIAAELLGGDIAVTLVADIMKALQAEPVPSQQTLRHLIRLENLLFLQNVDDPDSIEAGLFASIAPDEPIVEDICMLADGLREALNIAIDSPDIAEECTQCGSHSGSPFAIPAIGGTQ
jgi:hypothetical protein